MTDTFSINKDICFEVDYIDERSYWFVRTNAGEYYDEFKNEGYIAVGFNEITDPNLIEKSEEDPVYKKALIEKIKTSAELDDTKSIKPGLIINQLKRFILEMNVNDIVLIPSLNSQYITFGKIVSDVEIATLNATDDQDDKCPYIKRRKVRWLKTISRDKLDPYLYKAIYSHHVITNVSDSKSYINRSLSSVYVESNKAHITFKVNTTDEVSLADIRPLLYGFENIAKLAQLPADIIKDAEEAKIKINVQSPGPIEYITGLSCIALIGGFVFLYNAYATAKKQGGEMEFSMSPTKGITFSAKFNAPTNENNDIKPIIDKILASEAAKEELKKMSESIDKLNVTLPNETDAENTDENKTQNKKEA